MMMILSINLCFRRFVCKRVCGVYFCCLPATTKEKPSNYTTFQIVWEWFKWRMVDVCVYLYSVYYVHAQCKLIQRRPIYRVVAYTKYDVSINLCFPSKLFNCHVYIHNFLYCFCTYVLCVWCVYMSCHRFPVVLYVIHSPLKLCSVSYLLQF